MFFCSPYDRLATYKNSLISPAASHFLTGSTKKRNIQRRKTREDEKQNVQAV